MIELDWRLLARSVILGFLLAFLVYILTETGHGAASLGIAILFIYLEYKLNNIRRERRYG